MSRIEELRRVADAFRMEALAGDVRHDLISPMSRVPTLVGWLAFQEANSPPGPLVPQTWEVSPDLSACGRYEGDPVRINVFRRMATEAYSLLSEVECPEGGWVHLPKEKGHLGWIDAVYRTARCYATADLRAVFGWWNWTGAITLDEDNRWAEGTDEAAYPLHPAYERLVSGLFRSSAEAIWLWFDPDHAEQVGESVQETPVAFTRPNSPPEIIRRPPRWDGKTLWFNNEPVKSFASQATSCKELLDAVQQSGWRTPLDNPLVNGVDDEDARLGNTIYRINSVQKVVEFYRNGWGQVCWRWPDGKKTCVYRGRKKREK